MRTKLEWFNDFYRYVNTYKDKFDENSNNIIKNLELLFPIDNFLEIIKYIEIFVINEYSDDIKRNNLLNLLLLTNQEIKKFHVGEIKRGKIIKPKEAKVDLTMNNQNILNLI